jgi:hypothetical protein
MIDMENRIRIVDNTMNVLPGTIGFLNEDKQVTMPVGRTLEKNVSFQIGKTLDNGTIVIKPLEGDLKDRLCILSATAQIVLDIGLLNRPII